MRMAILALAGGTFLAVTPASAATSVQIIGCETGECTTAYSYVTGLSGALGEHSGAYAFHPEVSDGGIGYTGTASSMNTVSAKGTTFQGSAYGDLSSGALHATATQSQGSLTSFVQLKDVLLFVLPTGMTSATATVSWTLEGSSQYNPVVANASLNGETNFQILTANSSGIAFDLSDFSPDYFVGSDQKNGTLTASFTILPNTYYFLQSTLSVSASSNQQTTDPFGVPVSYNSSSSIDYGNTAFFDIDLPDGVSLLSGSGMLLSDPYVPGPTAPPTSPVPEPATWALMVGGFGLIGSALRRRKMAIRLNHSSDGASHRTPA